MIDDDAYFDAKVAEQSRKSKEGVWQDFLEENPGCSASACRFTCSFPGIPCAWSRWLRVLTSAVLVSEWMHSCELLASYGC